MSAEVKSMKEWALYYAELGLAVFPLAYRNKVPAIEGGCKAATSVLYDLSVSSSEYEDYGFSEDEDKRLGEFCKNLEMRDKILLLQCAAEVYPNIVDELYCCIVIGMSYDKMNKKKFVALDRKDFYAYRKKTLAVFRAALQACNRYPFCKLFDGKAN